MKILVAYDGSECANTALDDLCHAGLPEEAEVLVLSVGAITSNLLELEAVALAPGYVFPNDPQVKALDDMQLGDAKSLAASAAARLQTFFPKWQIEIDAVLDEAKEAIVQKAAGWNPDLVVVGSHGRTGFRRFVLGSVSQHVLHHAHCSVRIGRRRSHKQDQPIRILVGIDASQDAKAALQSVAGRHWPGGTLVRVVGVVDYRSWLLEDEAEMTGTSVTVVVDEQLRKRISDAVDQAVRDLTSPGLFAVGRLLDGQPGHALVSEAEQWNADCIFVGARELNAFERLVLGSVSTTVASHAHCSVEVVRNQHSIADVHIGRIA